MFKKINSELNGIRLELGAITKSLRMLSERPQDPAPSADQDERLNSLEGAIERVAGVVDAGLTAMDAKGAAAKAAEERARGHMKRAENYAELAASSEGGEEVDPFEQAARQYAATTELPSGDADPGNGLHAMPESLAARGNSLDEIRAAKRAR